MNKFSGILRGKKNKAEYIGATNTQYTPPVSQELAWMRLVLFYHKIASKSPSCPTLGRKVKELDFAYLRAPRTSLYAVFTYLLVLFRTQEEQAMNKTEQEALSKILFALFLESPKRKALLGQQQSEKVDDKPTRDHKIRTYQLGDIAHGSK